MQNLKLKSAEGLDVIVLTGDREKVDINSPAAEVVVDFSQQTPAIVPASTGAEEAIHWLQMEKFPWQLVTGKAGELLGILVKGAGAEQQVMRYVANGADRSILSAKDIMLPLAQMHVVQQSEVQRATVGELLNSLKDSGAQYCLVVGDDEHQVHGLISVQDVIDRLGVALQIRSRPTFVDIFNAVHP
jgi:predicted transcriptional regulator